MNEPDDTGAGERRVPDLLEALDGQMARHRDLARQLAEIAEFSAEVHEQAARLHEEMADPRLDPEQLRRHAAADRVLAEREREAARED